MKKHLFLCIIWMLGWTSAHAQLPPGSIAPNFTVTDINGETHTLYNLLNEGKTVYLDFFATWCGPCWNYHNSNALKNIWNTYGPNGTNEAFVIMIEGDGNTNLNCLYGPSGCVGGTQGNWVANTPYPIVDDASVRSLYAVSYYPTIYMVCPGDYKVYETGQLNMAGLWNRRNQYCDLSATVELNTVTNVKCFGASNGSISVTASGGIAPYTYQWSTGVTNTTGVLNNIPVGTYACTVTPSVGGSATIANIVVEGPATPLTVQVVETNPAGCNGVAGSAIVAGAGGWSSGYNYAWNNGQMTEELFGVQAGTYTVSVTDDGGCTKTATVSIIQTPPPVASIATPPVINCSQPTVVINASASSSGSNFSYIWFPSNGGIIVSGGNTLTPVVSSAGTYTLRITDDESTCATFGVASVTANTTQPVADAGQAAAISCATPTTTLSGSGSMGPNFTYLWTASGGGNIVSGAGGLTPVVDAAGTYTLRVTNTTNGCTATATTSVSGNSSALATTATGGVITCSNPTTSIAASVSGSGITYAWSGPNGFTSTEQQPNVSATGAYTVVVTESASGCSGTAQTEVVANNTPPVAGATGGAITCASPTVTLSGSSSSSQSDYLWMGPGGFASSLPNPTVNLAGEYTLVVMDTINGCTASASATVNLNTTAPAAGIAPAANLNCNTTQVQLNGAPSSQGAQFSYNWSTTNGNILSGANTLTPLVNMTGNYDLVVTNSLNGCTNTSTITVNQSATVTAAANAGVVSCNGLNNGVATSQAGGGNGSYNYLWSNGATTADISNLQAGNYVVIVTDGEGCTASATATVTQPDPLAVNATATPQTANGVNDGTAAAAPNGGTSPYQYAWSNGANTATITNLAPGAYTVTVSDQNNCTSVQVVTVNSFNCALAANFSVNHLSCFESNDGSANVILSGANDPVNYLWSNGATTQNVTGLSAGAYTVQITDANNCPAALNILVNQPSLLLANATATPESAAGANDGTASAAPVGGTGTYTYAWSNGANTPTIAGLAPGAYTVTIQDANACETIQSVIVNSFDCVLLPQMNTTAALCFGQSNGTALVVLNGGTAPFNYLWSNGATGAAINGLTAGEYSVQITDANGCQTSASATVNQPAALNATVVNTVQPLCPADPTGQINADITGGVSGYLYLWNNGATTLNLTGVPAGAYQLMVTDANGCTASTGVNLNATDTEAPSIAVNNTTLFLNGSGTAAANAQSLQVVVSDNCAPGSVSVAPAAFDCSQLGAQTVVVTASDAAGNVSTRTVVVNVVDNLAPTVNCPVSVTRCSYDNIVVYNAPTASDNCLLGGVWQQTAGEPSGSEFPVGVTTQTYQYTDPSGNTGQCSFDVIISAPVSIAPTVINASGAQANGSIDITVTGGNAPYAYAWTFNGNPFSDQEDLNNLAAGQYAVVVTDANGCQYESGNIEVKNVSSANEPAWLSQLSLRPNPTSTFTQLLFPEVIHEQIVVTLLDMTGKTVATQTAENAIRMEIDCTTLPSGAYTVRIQTKDTVGARRLIIHR